MLSLAMCLDLETDFQCLGLVSVSKVSDLAVLSRDSTSPIIVAQLFTYFHTPLLPDYLRYSSTLSSRNIELNRTEIGLL